MDNDKIMALKRGMVTMFSIGSYSEYVINGAFVATEDVTIGEMRLMASEFACEGQMDRRRAFNDELIRRGLLVKIDYIEVHLGEMGALEPEVLRP